MILLCNSGIKYSLSYLIILVNIYKMRCLILCLLILAYHFDSIAQSKISTIVKQGEVLTEYYDMPIAGSKVLYLPMEYGKSGFSIQQEEAIKNLKNANVIRVDMVYSDYPAKVDFSPLTKKRLEALYKILPQLFSNNKIEFRKVRQTIGKTKDVAATLEHGFFIYFRPIPVKGSGLKEVTKLKSLLKDAGLEPSVPKSSDSSFWCWQLIINVDTIDLPEVPEGATREISRIAVKDALSMGYISPDNEKLFLAWGDSAYHIKDHRDEDCLSEDGSYFIYDLVDTTVTKVFSRHNWSRSLIISDVTGSMHPYTSQLLKWLKLNLIDNEKKYFVFFNDGDDKDDKEKKVGVTGGIYSVFTSQYDEVEKTIIKAMTNGSGGDAPENNIEALIESNKICKDCDSVIMIVDNWAPIKDISLLKLYSKPVKVVVCGVFDRINKDYLKLARDTKGSIHLIEEDIYNLSEIKEGETIKINGVIYKLIKGEFVDLTEKSS